MHTTGNQKCSWYQTAANVAPSGNDMSLQIAKARAMLEQRKKQLLANQNNKNNDAQQQSTISQSEHDEYETQPKYNFIKPVVHSQEYQSLYNTNNQLYSSFVPASNNYNSIDLHSNTPSQQQQPLRPSIQHQTQQSHLPTPSTNQSQTPQQPTAVQYLPVKLDKLIGLKFKSNTNKSSHKQISINAFDKSIDEATSRTQPINLFNIDDEQHNDTGSNTTTDALLTVNGHTASHSGDITMHDNDDVDPLDAYMTNLQNNDTSIKQKPFNMNNDDMHTDQPQYNNTWNTNVNSNHHNQSIAADSNERYFNDEETAVSEDDLDNIDDGVDRSDTKYKNQVKKVKGINIPRVNHSTINYPLFRKNLYIEDISISSMTDDDVALYRLNELEGVRIRGNNVVRPVKTWLQCGLSDPVYNIIHNIDKFDAPFPIQAQAIPVLMSGRDCIACAKTGSGKSLAFTLPLIRHVADQSELQHGDGPIALILVPTRELCIQLYHELNKYSKPHSLRTVAVYGGTGIGQNINSIKSGCHILIATPGRLIDIFNTNNGKLISLTRITYVVLDEADRMFDMGFAPQIELIIQNIRPDRQTVMFSATFPRIVESVARKILHDPIEIIIGGRSIISEKITQLVEIFSDDQHKIKRLLQLLNEYTSNDNQSQILIFVDRQDTVDELFSRLLEYGYSCVTVHGAMDQSDRDNNIIEYKSGHKQICIATSIIARGLDIKNLSLVINYTCPRHIEDYIHRIGRTGRGNSHGTAVTFLYNTEYKLAAQLVAVLHTSKQSVSNELLELSKLYKGTINKQLLLTSGYGGRGFKFDANETSKGNDVNKQQQLLLDSDSHIMNNDVNDDNTADVIVDRNQSKLDDQSMNALEQLKNEVEANESLNNTTSNDIMRPDGSYEPIQQPTVKPAPSPQPADKPLIDSIAVQIAAAKKAAEQLKQHASGNTSVAAFALKAAMINQTNTNTNNTTQPGNKYYSANHHMSKKQTVETELVINDYNQHIRWKLVSKNANVDICEQYNVSISNRGVYVPPGKSVPPGEKPLYLIIEGADQQSINAAKRELLREIESASMISSTFPQSNQRGNKYNVLGAGGRDTNLRIK